MTAALAVEEGEGETEFVATTVNVYGVPFVNPVTTAVVIVPLTSVNCPPLEVTL